MRFKALQPAVASILIAARRFGNRAESATATNSTEPARSDTSLSTLQSNAIRVGIGKGNSARVLDNGLKIQLDTIRFDQGSNQYLVSFSLSSPSFKELMVRDGKASSDRIYTYPADGKFKIQLLSAEENLADFSIEEAQNSSH